MTLQEKAFGFLTGLLKPAAPFDPTVFSDPFAQSTPWTPLVAGGSSFCTHRLKKIDNTALEFRPTFGLKLFCSVFVGMGAAFAFIPLGAIYRQFGGFHFSMLFSPLFGLFFCALGILMYYMASAPILFDLKRRSYSKGWKSSVASSSGIKGVQVELDRVRGLQVLSEYCSGNKSSYYSYELNLVLDDASRVNVVDHGDLKALREDAQVLGQSLEVPVWDMEVAKSKPRESGNSSGPFPDSRMWQK